MYWKPSTPLSVVFPPGIYQDDGSKARVNLTLRPTNEQIFELNELDPKILQLCIDNADRLFGKAISEAQVRERYQGALRLSEKYPASVRVKMNTETVKYWNRDGTAARAPENWV